MKYKLYDLMIVTEGKSEDFNCSHVVGEGLIVEGENIRFVEGTKQFSHYVLATLMPYISAKQRVQDKNDWMYFESTISCPDPNCGAIFRFITLDEKVYSYSPILH